MDFRQIFANANFLRKPAPSVPVKPPLVMPGTSPWQGGLMGPVGDQLLPKAPPTAILPTPKVGAPAIQPRPVQNPLANKGNLAPGAPAQPTPKKGPMNFGGK